ncbi:carboxypeptidase-like regulatory domain-containing protein [Gemmatimonadota bacterium]
MKTSIIGSILMAGVFLPLSLEAQVIQGRVVDEAMDRGVDGAVVTLLAEDSSVVRRVSTEDGGAFYLTIPEAGTYRVRVTALGYGTTVSDRLLMSAADDLELVVGLQPDPVELPGVVTVIPQDRRGRDSFLRRAAAGRGLFIDPEWLSRIEMYHPADALRVLGEDGVSVWWDVGPLDSESLAVGPIPRVRSALGNGCFVYLLDERPVFKRHPETVLLSPWSYWPLNSLLPSDIAAMEVYRYPGEVPPEFRPQAVREFYASDSTYVGEESCGIVMIWTKTRW